MILALIFPESFTREFAFVNELFMIFSLNAADGNIHKQLVVQRPLMFTAAPVSSERNPQSQHAGGSTSG